MVRLVDVPLDAGDPNKAVTDIEAAIQETAAIDALPRPAAVTNKSVPTDDAADPRFAGKSTAEIVSMYRNLESHSGRLASQLGEARNSVNALILGKRENDLSKGSGKPTATVAPADLLVNPTEALDRYLESRTNPEVSALKDRLAQLEAQLTQTVFTVNHPKAQDVTQDPAFAAWVRQTPLRSQLAEAAAQGDLGKADLLLREWQHAKSSNESTVTTTNDRAKTLARSVSLESSTASGEDAGRQRSTKTLSRRNLQALRMSNPDKYESQEMQNEIVRAYVEGRVTD
jgi:hypothetical protein